jgi:putative ABC transport system permease protein
MRNLRVGYGRPFTEVEMLERSRVLLLGKTIAEDLFPSDAPLGQTVKVNGFPFVVIGIMEGKGEVMGVDYDYRAYLPVTAAQRLSGNLQITTVYLKARSGELVDSAVSEVETILIRKYNNPDSFSIKSQEEILTTVRTVAAILTVMLGGIATVSLLVGGIGIMNIMLVSVTERTREIGLRKAVGAKSRDVMQQFLVEAFVLTMAGAALGIFLGVSGSSLVLALLQWPVFISWTAILVSVAFSAGTGLFFGLYPAQKAAALDPIVALRYE